MNRTLCPLCGSDNACAMEAKTGKCWCADVKFTPDLLARVPAQAQGEVCICRSCAEKAATLLPPP
ncbi:MAG: hypothetical protein EXR31_00695 [Betaproteobacteria bacterium]|nr:hypothetical protein [Betaproteobacteria bacterium]